MKASSESLELWYALAWIALYVVGSSTASTMGGLYPLLVHGVLVVLALVWIAVGRRFGYYGLCRSGVGARRFYYYLPLLALASCNLWFGLRTDVAPLQALTGVASMLCVGFLEEIIFRGFLFRAVAKDNVRTAVIITSLTFGLGHLVNLFNGNQADLVANLCQICYAVAFGFLFVTVLRRSGSLLACIAAHCLINCGSVWLNEANMTNGRLIIVSVILTLGAAAYAIVLTRRCPAIFPPEEVD